MAAPHKVLIVDDEPHILLYIRKILESLGVPEVKSPPTPQHALVVFDSFAPDLVLLDINMPGVSGIELLREMLVRRPDLPVVMLTGLASREVVETCRDAGASFFIRKDTPREEITRLLRELFEELANEQ
jgi:two-component system, chemotaxis family, chemotaxis protein CheY